MANTAILCLLSKQPLKKRDCDPARLRQRPPSPHVVRHDKSRQPVPFPFFGLAFSSSQYISILDAIALFLYLFPLDISLTIV